MHWAQQASLSELMAIGQLMKKAITILLGFVATWVTMTRFASRLAGVALGMNMF
jgi:hypothetical protein